MFAEGYKFTYSKDSQASYTKGSQFIVRYTAVLFRFMWLEISSLVEEFLCNWDRREYGNCSFCSWVETGQIWLLTPSQSPKHKWIAAKLVYFCPSLFSTWPGQSEQVFSPHKPKCHELRNYRCNWLELAISTQLE